jgi:hypothetical protein
MPNRSSNSCISRSTTAVFLSIVFAVSAFGCITEWNTQAQTLIASDRCPSDPGHVGARPSTKRVTTEYPNESRHGQRSRSAAAPALQHHKTASVAGDCGRAFRTAPSPCSLRGFSQTNFVDSERFELADPRQHSAGPAPAPPQQHLSLSSVGPSETDRGPPHS